LSEIKKHILILPKWYPNHKDIQLGIFIKKQALLLKETFQISVIYVQSSKTIASNFEIKSSKQDGIFEQTVYFKKATGFLNKLINFKRYKKAQIIGYKNLINKVDLVHVQVPIRPLFLALNLKRRHNIPFVVSEHWSGHLTGEFNNKNFIYKYLYKSLIKKASKISCVSEFLKTEFIKNTAITPIVIPNLIEKQNVPTLLNPSPSDQIRILSVNDYIDSIKNITGLLEGFSKAIVTNPTLHLILIGGGPDEELINETINKLNLKESHLTVLGRTSHDTVLEHMKNCDFYISNSNFETFGMTLAEALIVGKPVISKLCGGPNEFLNNTNSMILNFNNEVDLTSIILRMADSFHLFDSTKISKVITEKYGHSVILNKLEKFYNL